MKLLELEDHRLLNVELVTVVQMNHRYKVASVWDAGVVTVADSHILYRYYLSLEKIEMPAEEVAVQAG